MESIHIKMETIGLANKIMALKDHKAWGPDDINPKLLKECVNQLLLPLQLIFAKSLDTGQILEGWKKANIIPILKKVMNTIPKTIVLSALLQYCSV